MLHILIYSLGAPGGKNDDKGTLATISTTTTTTTTTTPSASENIIA